MTDTSHPDDGRLIAYLDGALSGEERDKLAARLAKIGRAHV